MAIDTRTKEEMVEEYAKRLSSKGKNRNLYLRMIGEFANFAEGNFERDTVERFLVAEREKHHYSDNSLRMLFGLLSTFFKRNKLEWPFNRGEGPIVREDSINAPALDPRTVKRMIEAVRESQDRRACAFLALSTTYGLRRQEIMNLKPGDINLKDSTLYIATLKHGRERTHLIPFQLHYALGRYDFSEEISDFTMGRLWISIEDMVQMKYFKRMGWHAVRRTLNTLLLRDFKEATVHSFLRWKQATSRDMTMRYSRTRFVGEEEEVVDLSGEALSVDEEIFACRPDGTSFHPFIDSWQ